MSGCRCGCCGWSGGPAGGRVNLPGAFALPMRVPTHGSVLAAMIARLSSRDHPALAALTTRDAGDPALALLDAWACVADVLGFYSERIALEGYLGTATERWSLERMGELLGHVPRPGVAASTALVFTVDESAAAASEVVVPAGTRVQSVPAPGQTAQTFETSIDFTARPEWNAIPVRRTRQRPFGDRRSCWIAGTVSQLAIGDSVLFIRAAAAGSDAPPSDDWALVVLTEVEVQSAENRTRLRWKGRLPAAWGADPVELHAFRAGASLFGHNAPGGTPPTVSSTTTKVHLDAVYRGAAPGQWAVLLRGSRRSLRRVKTVTTLTKAVDVDGTDFASKVTRLTLAAGAGDEFTPRGTTVHLRSEALPLAEFPSTAPVTGDTVKLAPDAPEIPVGALVAIEELPADPADVGVAPPQAQIATVMATSRNAARYRLTLSPALTGSTERLRTVVRANVVPATHGESITEVLGRGDAGGTFQSWTLRTTPLTHVAAANERGAVSTLAVRVGDVSWTEVPTLVDRTAAERIFATRAAVAAGDEGKVVVQFGDGAEIGPRLPSGATVTATARRGLGTGGNLDAGQIRMLVGAPLGVRGAFNAVPSLGGADPEPVDALRESLPGGVLTLGRIVSLRDHEDFARNYAGVAKARAEWGAVGGVAGPPRRVVLLTAAGADAAILDATHPTRDALRKAIAAASEPHVAVELLAHRPVSVGLAGTLTVDPAYDPDVVMVQVDAALCAAFAFANRQLGARLAVSELVAAIHGVSGVVAVDLDSVSRTPPGPGGVSTLMLPGDPSAPRSFIPARPAEQVGGQLLGAELLVIDPDSIALEVAA